MKVSRLSPSRSQAPWAVWMATVQDCYEELSQSGAVSPLPRFQIDGLRAALDISGAATQLQLNLTGGRSDQTKSHRAISWYLQIAGLGQSKSYEDNTINVSCRELGNGFHDRALLTHQFIYSISNPKLLDSLDVSLQIHDTDGRPYACAKAHVTPSLNHVLSAVALYIPIAVFLTVLVVALWHEFSDIDSASQSTLQIGPVFREPARSHLTRIAEYLSYLQHIFFSASLSLHYPGFLRPLAAKTSWSTLMTPTARSTRRPHGIYEVNGTFGGTAGLELMTQVMGAPVTMRTWINVASLSLMLLVALAILFQLGHRLPYTSVFLRGESARRLRGTADYGLRGTVWTVLRFFLTYFLTPITAWTTFQLTYATFLPLYHVVITTVVIALLVVALWWSIAQNSLRNLGYLLIDASPKHLLQTPGVLSRSQDRYAMASFALMFVRGAAAGGLQIAGLAQLLALRSSYSCFSSASLSIPGLAGPDAKAVVGLVILTIHAVVLVGVFLLPALFGAGTLLAHCVCKMMSAKRSNVDEGFEV
ncbi:integral membrane protein [Colletotrichum tofieldiae]|nr:integral membrane protein [Colletotrichum tofieldiae]